MLLALINQLTGLRLDAGRTWTYTASTRGEVRFGISPDELANPAKSFPIDISVRLCYVDVEIEPVPPPRCVDIYYRRKMIGSLSLLPIRKSGRHSKPKTWSLYATPDGYDAGDGYLLEVCPDHIYCSPDEAQRVPLEDVAIQLASIEDRSLRIYGNIEFSDLYRAAFDRDVFKIDAVEDPCREVLSDIRGIYSLCLNCRVAIAEYPYIEGVPVDCGPCKKWDPFVGKCVYDQPVCPPGFTPCADDPCECCPVREDDEEELPFPGLGPSPFIYGWRSVSQCDGDNAPDLSSQPWNFQMNGVRFSVSSWTPEIVNTSNRRDEIGGIRDTDTMYFVPNGGVRSFTYSYTAFHVGERFAPGTSGEMILRPDGSGIRDCMCRGKPGIVYANTCWCTPPRVTGYCALRSELAIGRVVDGVFYPDMSLGEHDRGRPPAPAPGEPPEIVNKPCRVVYAEAKVSLKVQIGRVGTKVSYTFLRTPPKCTKITGNELLDEIYAIATQLGLPTGVDLKIVSIKTVIQGYCQCD